MYNGFPLLTIYIYNILSGLLLLLLHITDYFTTFCQLFFELVPTHNTELEDQTTREVEDKSTIPNEDD